MPVIWPEIARLLQIEMNKGFVTRADREKLDHAWRINPHRFTEMAVRLRQARAAERETFVRRTLQ